MRRINGIIRIRLAVDTSLNDKFRQNDNNAILLISAVLSDVKPIICYN